MEMKKAYAGMLAVLMMMGLCVCGREAAEVEEATTTEAITEVTTEATTTTTVSVTLPIEYPASYRDAPAAYQPILDAFYYQAQHGGGEWDINELYIVEPWFFEMDDLGYAIKDINKDGTPELLLLTSAENYSINFVPSVERPFILSLFTLVKGKPVHLAYYWRRERVQIAADGTIYFIGGFGGSYTRLYTYELEARAGELTQLSEYIRESGSFFRGPYGGQPMEEDEFNELVQGYVNLPSPMQFQFIPIEQ